MATHSDLLFVVFDDLAASVTGSSAEGPSDTPNLDRLAARGVRFVNAQCPSPLCAPARAAMLTGLSPLTTGIVGNFSAWSDHPQLNRATPLFQHLRNHGYRPMGTGKLFHNQRTQWRPDAWTHRDGTDGYGVAQSWGPWPWDGRAETARHWAPVRHPDLPPGLDIHDNMFCGLDLVPDVPPDPTLNAPGHHGWQLYGRPFRYLDDVDRDPLPDERNAAWVESMAESGRFDGSEPLLLAVGFNRPHGPWIVPRRSIDELEPRPSLATRYGPPEAGLPPLLRPESAESIDAPEGARWGYSKYQHVLEAGGDAMLDRWLRCYRASCRFADAQLGRVIAALDRIGRLDNMLVVVTSDHGYHLGEHGWLYKNSPWESACRVPLVISGPGIVRGQTCDTPVSTTGLFATICDRLGLDPHPHGHDLPLDDPGFADRLDHPIGPGDAVALTVIGSRHPPDATGRRPLDRQYYSLRTKEHRLIRCPDGTELFYNMTSDPCERHGMIDTSRDNRELNEARNRLAAIVPR